LLVAKILVKRLIPGQDAPGKIRQDLRRGPPTFLEKLFEGSPRKVTPVSIRS
jgi:hypothetical protein